MQLFRDITIKSDIHNYVIDDFDSKLEIVTRWRDDYHNGTLKTDNETVREGGYYEDIFVGVLGYKRKPDTQANLDPKYSLQGKIPDGVLGTFADQYDDDVISAVIELKGASIPLDQPQKREKNYTPIEQGFGYKRLLRSCPFVIISNFYELRLYHDNELDYEIWTLDDLVNPQDDYYRLRKFCYLLGAKNMITRTGTSVTESLISAIRLEEKEITKRFYRDYKEKRYLLLKNLYQHNESLRANPDLLVEKGQKLIDRIIFVCFAEDCGLLPADTLAIAKDEYYKSTSAASLKSALQQVFTSVDQGNERWGIPHGYNGGLFAHDEVLFGLKVTDEVMSHIVDFGNYNFAEDVSVNILGHIFEQSISDLEGIKQKINDQNKVESIDGGDKRKKDGIFYTPEYIVDYIVKNSLGAYLKEKETELINTHRLDQESQTPANFKKSQQTVYTKYQQFLQTVTVLDPACGSGAFLVRVFDYLLAEHRRVGKILGQETFFGETEEYENTYKDILKNNIYGVDLNAESVEITKLSLWLKSAQKNKKLTTLDDNIKCGNSLISDPEVAGDKAFDWNVEFKDIMDNGGFDVIVGNPPYVSYYSKQSQADKNTIKELDYLKNNYSFISNKAKDGRFNTSMFFLERGMQALKKNHTLSFIVDTNIHSNPYQDIRQWLADNFSLLKIINEIDAFEGVGSSQVIITIKKVS